MKSARIETINELGELCDVWIPKNTLVHIVIDPTSEISEQILNETVREIREQINDNTTPY